jgi:peptide-methionine (R)-S-oxide reductase
MVELSDTDLTPISKTAGEWKASLNDQEYYILREKGTERAFSGDLWNHKGTGVYTCRGCQLPLFHSDTKFKSGTGWPSYYQPIREGHVTEKTDRSYGMVRTEVLCGRCSGHLGHVFEDGPEPTGLRYCINSASMDFKEE